jgi:hypothetical protein
MTRTDLPPIGAVVHYVYPFLHEAKLCDEGVKERPVIVIDVDHTTGAVAVVPVTTKGDRYCEAIVIPDPVANAAGLALKSAVLVTQYNSFTWLGYDIRPLAQGYIAGRLPPGFTNHIRQLAIAGGIAIDRD